MVPTPRDISWHHLQFKLFAYGTKICMLYTKRELFPSQFNVAIFLNEMFNVVVPSQLHLHSQFGHLDE